jgi:alkylhydroperoxidase family enzyme
MSRLSGIDPAQADAPVSETLESQKKNWGQYLNPYLVYARRPSILQGVTNMWAALSQSGLLPSTLTSLICRRIASINGCVF